MAALDAGKAMSMFTPTLKSMDVIINKLKAAKSIEPGDLSGLSDKILGGGGLQNLLKNPSGGSGGKAKSDAQGAAQQAGTVPPQNNVARTSLNTLAADVQDLMDRSADLVGLGSDPDGFLVTLGLSQVADTLGTNHVHATSVLLKPLNSETELAAVSAEVWELSDGLVKGRFSAEQVALRAGNLSLVIRKIVDDSEAAGTALMNLASVIKSVSAASAMLASGSPEWKSAMERGFADAEVKAALEASNSALLSTD